MPFSSVIDLSWPRDVPGQLAAIACVVALATPVASRFLPKLSLRAWIVLWAGVSFLLSAAYVQSYIGGLPRIIDATAYWLEARGFASGLVTWIIEEPTALIRGRFLIHHQTPEGVRIGVIFPPGYPALLALGFLAKAPMLVGPFLAAVVTVLTCLLARALTDRESVVRIVAVVSALNACLRYHTADTMSHGLAAVLLTGAVVVALHASSANTRRTIVRRAWWALCGILAGWLVCTRPVSALALALVGLPVLLWWMVTRRRFDAMWIAAGVAPAMLLLVLHQHALTGSWLTSAQSRYYMQSDGPPGCFRYGFGPGIGCLIEHYDFVTTVVRDNFGPHAAFVTTVRRVYAHLADPMNYAPFGVFLFWGVWHGRRNRKVMIAIAIPIALMIAYVPFYFDGSYHGAGARFYADGLPFEHVLLALGFSALARKFHDVSMGRRWATAAAASLCLCGFAVHGSHMHAVLRARDNGRPMFEQEVVKAALGENPRGIMFVDTDHGFFLAYDPTVRDPTKGLVVMRTRYDDRDLLAWDRLGRPEAHRYLVDPWSPQAAPPRVVQWIPPADRNTYVFEAEAEWPPFEQTGGYVLAKHVPLEGCVSGLVLTMKRTGAQVCVLTEIPVPTPGHYAFRGVFVGEEYPMVHTWLERGNERVELPITVGESRERACLPTAEVVLRVDGPGLKWGACASRGQVDMDRVEVRLVEGP